jgi:SOS-response transcriptional repressor LexA
MASAAPHRTRLGQRVLGYRGFQVLGFVRNQIEERGMAPSYSMICDELGIGTKGEVASIVGRLEKRGLLRRAGCGRVRRIALP